ncbi:MAG: right-handed parallel beta-helix repeat-containing protein [Pyrinomonadaceae bacterium]|nr:right-handed parallel beta-helix repeat-containing protein [Pyrinomonadaceae bacterium]
MHVHIPGGKASVRRLFETSGLQSRFLVHLMAVLSLVAAVAALGPSVGAATINVTGIGDTLSNNGVCTIREAIINANNNAATWSDCAAGLGADLINLPAGTITFSIPNTPSSFSAEELTVKGDLDIRSSLTIIGHPDGTTINGAALDRIFDINPDADGDPSTPTPAITVHINNLTITNGRQNDVGAVRVQPNATVTIGHCTISNSVSWANDAGGIGILNGATLTMTNSTVSGNTALLLDGGIKNEGNLHLNFCTITRNTGVHNRAQGLGCNGPVCNVRNTIIAGNGINRADTEGNITSLGYNIIGKLTDDSGNLITIVAATTGDQFGVTSAQIKLGVLGPNGGPTRTHELLPGSVAIDKGKSDGLATDQRLLKRPCDHQAIANAVGGDGADIGAFEVQGCVPPDDCCCRRVRGRLIGTCCPKPTPLRLSNPR